MGKLTPGATYVYEKANGITYAREVGSIERHPIGWEFDQSYSSHLIWSDIQRAAKTNPALQKALDRVIMIYRLSKDNPL